MNKFLGCVVVALLCVPAAVEAQPAPAAPAFSLSPSTVLLHTATGVVLQVLTPNLTAGEPFHVQANHTGVDTVSYTLFMDGTALETKPVSALTAGVIDFFRPAGTTAGTHTASVRANGPQVPPLTTASTPLTFTVNPPTVPAPPAFTNIKIIR